MPPRQGPPSQREFFDSKPDRTLESDVAARALRLARGGAPALPQGAILVVRTPGEGWFHAVRDALEAGALGPGVTKADCLLVAGPQAGKAAQERLENALVRRRALVAVCEDERAEHALPRDLVAAADATLRLQPLPWAECVALAAEEGAEPGGDTPPEPDAETLGRMTPRAWLLAFREDHDSATLLRRVVEIASFRRETRRDDVPKARLESLPGMGREADAWAAQVVADLVDYRAGRLAWVDLDRGVLLAGPPGCGKTSFAAALAGSAGVSLVVGSHSAWQAAGHQGDMLREMRRTFAQARAAAPCILFLDELDSFGVRGGGDRHNEEYSRQVVNALLAELDGAVQREGVVVVGATNAPERVEPALLRSGRLERVIDIPPPDAAAMERILRVHLGGALVGECLDEVARVAAGRTGADAERWCREARRRARTERRAVSVEDLLAVIPPRRVGGSRAAMAFTRAGLVRVH